MSHSLTVYCRRSLLVAVATLLIVPVLALDTLAQQRIRFGGGQTFVTVRGSVTGHGEAAYLVSGSAGQKLRVELNSANEALYFNVVDPSTRVAIEGDPAPREVRSWSGVLSETRDYLIVVYLVRAEARRGTTADFTGEVYLTGAARGGGGSGGSSHIVSLDYEAGGTGNYTVDDDMGARPVSKVRVLLQPDGRARVEVSLGGDGFILHGNWSQSEAGGPQVDVSVTHGYSGDQLDGFGTLTLRGDREWSKIDLQFKNRTSGNHCSLLFKSGRG